MFELSYYTLDAISFRQGEKEMAILLKSWKENVMSLTMNWFIVKNAH